MELKGSKTEKNLEMAFATNIPILQAKLRKKATNKSLLSS